MKLIVSHLAQLQIKHTAQYLHWRNGKSSMLRFLAVVRKVKQLLRCHPSLGPIEPLLSDLPKSYRGIVVTPYNKLIYSVRDDVIEIVDFWDTRRDPAALVEEIRNS